MWLDEAVRDAKARAWWKERNAVLAEQEWLRARLVAWLGEETVAAMGLQGYRRMLEFSVPNRYFPRWKRWVVVERGIMAAMTGDDPLHVRRLSATFGTDVFSRDQFLLAVDRLR